MKGVLSQLVRWARHAGTIDFCPALAVLVCPVKNFICLTAHFFTLLVPIAQQPGQGSRAGSPVSVSLDILMNSSFLSHRRRGSVDRYCPASSSRYQEQAKNIRTDKHILMRRYLERTLKLVFRILDILVWIRIQIRGSRPLTQGFGSGSFYFHD